MIFPTLDYQASLPLVGKGDCSLIGVSPDLTLFVEEIDAEGLVAQQAMRLDGTVLARVDEAEGDAKPLPLPPELSRPQTVWHTMSLNFAGPRHRGLRGPERVFELVRGINMQDKMALIQRFNLPVTPPMILGLAESYVLAEAPLLYPNVFVVCRRARIAYALAEEQLDADQQPYDYDTLVVYTAHIFDRTRDSDVLLTEPHESFPDVTLRRPMDCMIAHHHLFIADGGDDDHPNAVHIWQIHEPPQADDKGDPIIKRLYG